VTKPNPENCKSRSSKSVLIAVYSLVHSTAQNSSDNLRSYLKTSSDVVYRRREGSPNTSSFQLLDGL